MLPIRSFCVKYTRKNAKNRQKVNCYFITDILEYKRKVRQSGCTKKQSKI